MKNKNTILSFFLFLATGFSTLLLFGGLFASRWEYVIQHTFDTMYILTFGTLVPLFFLAGVIFLWKSISGREPLFALLIVIGILTFLFCAMFYSSIFPSIIELYQIKLGLK